jgi:hypothetical protein
MVRPEHLERFRREARAAARLHHTNIVPVFGVGEDQGVHYYAMQFIHGQGLDAVLEEVRRLRDSPNADSSEQQSLAATVAQSMVAGRFHAATESGLGLLTPQPETPNHEVPEPASENALPADIPTSSAPECPADPMANPAYRSGCVCQRPSRK